MKEKEQRNVEEKKKGYKGKPTLQNTCNLKASNRILPRAAE